MSDPLKPLAPEGDPDALIDDGPTPIDPPTGMGPPRPPESFDRALAQAAADRALALEQQLARERTAHQADREILMGECDRLRSRAGELAAEVVRLKKRCEDLAERIRLLDED